MSKTIPQSLHSRKANGVAIIPTTKSPTSRTKTSLKAKERGLPTYKKTISAQKADKRPQPAPIPSYLKPNQKKEMQQKQEKSLTMKSYLDDADCISLREQLMDNSDLSEIETERLEKLLLHLREYSVDCAAKRQYDDAQLANSMMDYINKDIALRGNQIIVDRSLEDSYERESEELQAKHKDEQDSLNAKFDQKRERLEQSLKEELDKFEAEWKDEMPTKYRKASTTLLNLIDKEKRLAKSGKFEEAKLAKRQVDEQEAKEVEQQQKQMIKDYKIAKSKLDKKQNEKRELFENNYKHNMECLHAKQMIELSHLDNRMNVVNRIQEEKGRETPKVVPQVHVSMTSVEGQERERVLPPLIAPNDDEGIAEFRRKEAEKRKKAKSQASNKSNKSSVAEPQDVGEESSLFLTKSQASPEEDNNKEKEEKDEQQIESEAADDELLDFEKTDDDTGIIKSTITDVFQSTTKESEQNEFVDERKDDDF